MIEKLFKAKEEIKDAPALAAVEIIEVEPNRLVLTFKPGTQRTGSELQTAASILIKNKCFNFIKSEKVSFWDNVIKQISFSFID